MEAVTSAKRHLNFKNMPSTQHTHYLHLLHWVQGVDYINIMLLFFEEAVELQKTIGLQSGTGIHTVIMENCSFYHGHFVEPLLTSLHAEYEQ